MANEIHGGNEEALAKRLEPFVEAASGPLSSMGERERAAVLRVMSEIYAAAMRDGAAELVSQLSLAFVGNMRVLEQMIPVAKGIDVLRTIQNPVVMRCGKCGRDLPHKAQYREEATKVGGKQVTVANPVFFCPQCGTTRQGER